MLQEQTIDYAEAKRALDALVQEIQQRGKAGVIAVTEAHGELIAFARMDGAPLSSLTIAMNKAYSAARERKPRKRSETPLAIRKRGSNRLLRRRRFTVGAVAFRCIKEGR